MKRRGPSATSVDSRLIPAALAVWAIALTGLYLGWPAALAVGALAGLAGLAALRRMWCGRVCAVALMLCGPIAAIWIGGQIHRADTHPLRLAAERGAPLTAQAEVVERPRGVRTEGFGARPGGVSQVVFLAKVQGATLVVLAPAERWRNLLPGQTVDVRGTLVPPRKGDLTVALLRVRGPPAHITEAPVWQRAAAELRDGLRKASEVLDPEAAGLLPALVAGDTDGMSPRVVDEFRTAGLSHLLAVSGANLAILCGAVLILLRFLRAGPRTCAVGAMVALVGFVVLAGPEPSVLRAAVMGAVGLLALVLGRERSALSALAIAVLGLVFYDPALAAEPGFALSVVATASLVLFAPRWARAMRDRGVPVGVAEALAVPVAANLATAPLVAGLSGQVSLVAVGANLVAAPVVAPATVLGVLAAVVAQVHPAVAELLVRIAGPEVDWLLGVGRHAAAVPGAAVTWPKGWLGALLLAVVIGVAVLVLRLRRTRVLAIAVLVGGFVALVPLRGIAPGWPPDGWAVVGCDVGQGDAVVLATAVPGQAVVVDTGPDPGAAAGCLRALGVHEVPMLVLTHLHADHVGGLSAVLADRTVGVIAVGPLRAPDWAWREVERQARAKRVRVVEPVAGERFAWPGLELEVIGPRRGPVVAIGDSNTVVNDYSLVLRAYTAAGRVLLTGDIELAGQAGLLDRDLSADVLKVPHHGSRYSLPSFLARVRPRVALVSVGAGNRYGHPSPHVLDVLRKQGALVLRTDEDGDLAVLPGARIVRRKGRRRWPRCGSTCTAGGLRPKRTTATSAGHSGNRSTWPDHGRPTS
ncbi:competence protein ComEC [Lentzea sp. NBRC 105346]|uniref:DNA internalization-related competence protein ComEC/Rec2 n=1 Tax=Lentzea sp. NBRC 105346 TaxID=3032205 RepID=UPI0025569626|nr:DNA internalization-related competence protein ComEC/Rec2 [Lentzea sp. NBRC 105346]GLZ34048.1 competence protein ComEC [Lentzea sp. NBRC 105346]